MLPDIKKLNTRRSGQFSSSFEYFFNFIIEVLSTIDLVTDAYLIYKFA